jgi:glycosyltransferase involved in cell wall biosynthesis
MRLGLFRTKPVVEIAVSEEIRKESISKFEVPAARVLKIFNPVDVKRFENRNEDIVRSFYDENTLSKYDFVISSVANIEYRKGFDILVNAINILVETNKNIRPVLVVAGKVLDKSYWKSCCDMANFEIIHCNFIKPEVIYWSSDVHVLASRQEALPVVVLESMSAKTCTIRSRSQGAEDQIEHNKNGFLFENENTDELATILGNVYRNPKMKEEIARAGNLFMKERFDNEIIVEQLLRCYAAY